MRPSILRALLPGIVLVLMAAPGTGAPSDFATVPLHLTAGALRLEPAGDGPSVVPRIAGFGLGSRPGEPMLPLKVLLVAIPEGSVPELEVLSTSSQEFALRVAPVPRLRVRDREVLERLEPGARGAPGVRGAGGGQGTYDDEFAADARLYSRDQDFPAAPLRLGKVGYMREQRFVEVLYSPLLYNPARGRVRFIPEVEARVRLTLPEGGGISTLVRPSRPDPLF